MPDSVVLKLSDLFELPGDLSAEDREIALELSVKLININHGRNAALVEKCQTLAEYSAFIAKAKEFEKAAGDRAQALKLAIEYCREHDILKEFLETHSTGGLMTLIKSVTFFGPTPFGLIHPPARRLAGVFWAGF